MKFFFFLVDIHTHTKQPNRVMNILTVSLPAVAIARLTAAVASVNNGPRFAGVTYRSKESNELARHTLILGASYENTVQTSLDVLSKRQNIAADSAVTRVLQAAVNATVAGSAERKSANAALKSWQAMVGDVRAAASELFVSLENTLTAHAKGEENPAYTKAGVYESICPGLKVSRVDGTFEIAGLSHGKTVLEAGTFKAVNSSGKTIAKDDIRRALPIGKFRTLALDVGALESVRIGGREIDVASL